MAVVGIYDEATGNRLAINASGQITTSGGGGASGTPADNFASPGAIPEQMSFPMVWDGTNWQRIAQYIGSYSTGALAGGVLSTGLILHNLAQGGHKAIRSANDGLPAYNALGAVPQLWDGGNTNMQRGPTIFKNVNAVAITAGTGATIWTPAAGKKFRLLGFVFSASAAASLIFGDNAVGTVIFRSPLLAAAGVIAIGTDNFGGIGIGSAAANNVLKLDVSATATVTGTVWGTEE